MNSPDANSAEAKKTDDAPPSAAQPSAQHGIQHGPQLSRIAAFRYLVQIPNGRFFLILLLCAGAAAMASGILDSFRFLGDLAQAPIMLYILAAMLMIVARIVLRGNPEYMPVALPAVLSSQRASDSDEYLPPPPGRIAYLGWLLARTAWTSFLAICILIFVTGQYIASLVKPVATASETEARPVTIVLLDSRNTQAKSASIRIDERGVRVQKPESAAAPAPPAPPVPPVAPVAPGSPSKAKPPSKDVKIDAEDLKGIQGVNIGPQGIRIEQDRDGVKRTITIDSNGVRMVTPGASASSGSTDLSDNEKASAAVKRADAQAAKADAESARADAESAKADAESAKADAEAAKADAEAAKDQADADREEAEADAADRRKPQIVTIDLSGSDPAKTAKLLKEALSKARGTLEQEVRIELELERSKELNVPWQRVIKTLTFLLIVALTTAKVLAGSQYRTRLQAFKATQRAEGETLKRQLSDAQLKAMQAQVEPHFLFNTLASVDYLIETAPAQASKMQKSLIAYLRAALPQMRQASTTLGRELKLVTSYLEILKVRMEERLEVDVQAAGALAQADFPPMMLQTLVENAIKHGLEPKPEGGSVRVTAERFASEEGSNKGADMLRVTVTDSGIGLTTTGAAPTAGTGLGLGNIRERLELHYGASARLLLANNLPSGTLASIEIPYKLSV